MSTEVLPVPFSPGQWLRIKHLAKARAMSPLSLVMEVMSLWILLQDDPKMDSSNERRRRRWIRGHIRSIDLNAGYEADE